MYRTFTSIAATACFLLASSQAPSVLWQKCYGGSSDEGAYSIQITPDGGFIVVGYALSTDGDVIGAQGNGDYWVLKLDASGDIEWQQTLGGSGGDLGADIQLTSDGGYIVGGYSHSLDGDVTGVFGERDYWVVKLDDTGSIEWQRATGGSDMDVLGKVAQTADGGYIATGYTWSIDGDVQGNHGNADWWIVKLDASGTTDWAIPYGGFSRDEAYGVDQTSDGGYVVSGMSASPSDDNTCHLGGEDFWMVKLTATGSIDWQQCLGGTSTEEAFAMAPTSDGGYVLVGYSYSINGHVSGAHGGGDMWVVKVDAVGTFQWQHALGGSQYDDAWDVRQTADGGYVVAGYTYSNDGDVSGNHGIADAWVVRLDGAGSLLWQKALGGSDEDYATSVVETADGGIVLVGRVESVDGDVVGNHGARELWIVKLGGSNLGVGDVNGPAFSIAPNPATGVVLVTSPSVLGHATLTLTDAMGRDVHRMVMIGSTAELDLSGQPKGIYVVTLTSDEGSRASRLCLE